MEQLLERDVPANPTSTGGANADHPPPQIIAEVIDHSIDQMSNDDTHHDSQMISQNESQFESQVRISRIFDKRYFNRIVKKIHNVR